MAESLWHPHSGRNPRNPRKTRFSSNKDASKTKHTEGQNHIPPSDTETKNCDAADDASAQTSHQSNPNKRYPHFPRPLPYAQPAIAPQVPKCITRTLFAHPSSVVQPAFPSLEGRPIPRPDLPTRSPDLRFSAPITPGNNHPGQ